MNRRDFHKLSLAAAVAPLLPLKAAEAAAAPTANNSGCKFSVMLGTLPKTMTFEQRIQVAADAGLDSVEVNREYQTWTPRNGRPTLPN